MLEILAIVAALLGSAEQERVICYNDRIPDGYVWVAVTTNQQCPALLRSSVSNAASKKNNAKVIKLPGRSEVVCANSPIPRGYARVEQRTHLPCPGVTGSSVTPSPDYHDNAWLIRHQ